MGEIRNTRSEPRSDALHPEEDRRVVYALQGSGKTSQRANGCGWGADVCFTLNATDVHGVCYSIDMGGGYVPMIAISIDSYNQTASVEIAEPLRAAEGGDTKPKVLVVKDESIRSNN